MDKSKDVLCCTKQLELLSEYRCQSLNFVFRSPDDIFLFVSVVIYFWKDFLYFQRVRGRALWSSGGVGRENIFSDHLKHKQFSDVEILLSWRNVYPPPPINPLNSALLFIN